ncbi:hypothetical protein [Microlunatus sp. Gsoil 973]|uniref:hypothetical protein n=1 Tax=Microlunatus sp. Gsoil 973 TaxID=2672569 RepID=UPI0012B47ADA|nr:hypothetical protein [Microlunatus sp. Gsoil 973]QGN34363.1 hypothetical protein GJV80_17790 [Microlunatus sp. Gsoil 973]
MSILTDVLDSLGLLYVPEEAKNVLFWPPPTPAPAASWHPRLVEGVLAHPTGDLTRDNALRPRVSVMLGPGATLAGVATLLADLLDDITDRTTAAPLPSAHEVLEALLTYSATHLTNTPTDRLVVGFRMPLPVEIDEAGGTWVTNLETIQGWRPLASALLKSARDTAVARLPIDDPDAVRSQVTADLAGVGDLTNLGPALAARTLRNPYEPVLYLYELFRQVHTDRTDDEPGLGIAILAVLVQHQANLLATTTGGAAVLRRLWSALSTPAAAALPAARQADLVRSRRLVATALGLATGTGPDSWQGPLEIGPTVVPREFSLPASASPRRRAPALEVAAVAAAESPDGQQSMVLGRQLSGGSIDKYGVFVGPSYGGRVDPVDFIDDYADAIGSDPTQAVMDDRLKVVKAITHNEGWLDGARLRDKGMVSTGIQQWTVHGDDEATVLWEHFRGLDPDHFDLFLGLYGMRTQIWGASDTAASPTPTPADLQAANPWADPNVLAFPQVVPADPDRHFPRFVTLLRVDAGQAPVRMPTSAGNVPAGPRLPYFRGRVAGGVYTFTETWSARVRLAALCSIAYCVAEAQTAAKRFDRIFRDTNDAGDFTVPGAPHQPGTPVPRFTVSQLFTSEYGAALLLDAHINAPGHLVDRLNSHGGLIRRSDIGTAIIAATRTATHPGGVVAFDANGDFTNTWLERLAQEYQVARALADKPQRDRYIQYLAGVIPQNPAVRGAVYRSLSAVPGSFAGWGP